MSDNQPVNNVPAVQAYTPVELTGIFRTYFDRKKPNNVVWVRGIYIQRTNNNPQWAFAYDDLRDVNTSSSITLKISHNDREKLKSNSLVQVGGLIEFNPYNNGNIQMLLNVTRVEVVKDEFVTELDLKREEIRQHKNKNGYKNVDAILENILFKDQRPKVMLVFAGSSITADDFRSGVEAAANKIDFTKDNQSFGNASVLSSYLKNLDTKGFDAIALIRGGGGGIEALDAIEVLYAVSDMKTPIISAIGHVDERLYFKTLADKEVAVPHALGTYFKDMVDRVAAKRNSSRAALVQEVKKQYEKQIEDSNKKNKSLLEQIDKLQKQSQAQSKAFNDNLTKMQLESKKTLDSINKTHKESLDKIEKANSELQKSLQKVNNQLTESAKALATANGKANLLQQQLNVARTKGKGISMGTLLVVILIVGILGIVIGMIL